MKVGIGISQEARGWRAGREIARQALTSGGIGKPSLALAFCNSPLDASDLLAGARALIGEETPVVGGSAFGLITNETIVYQGPISGLLLIEAPDLQVSLAVAEGLDRGEYRAGRALAAQLPQAPSDVNLLFYDSIRRPATRGRLPEMNSSKPLLQGIADALPAHRPVIGAGLLGDNDFSTTVQFTGDRVATQSASILSLRGDLDTHWAIMHGCTLKDGLYYRITDIDGAILREVDHRPIVAVINEMYGGREWQSQLPVKRLTIGVNQGERFAAEFRESDYVNRLILGALPDESGIMLFEPDLEVGTEIQFMLRDARQMQVSVRTNAERLLERQRATGKTPCWGLYIDCAGRAALLSETPREEAAELQDIFNEHGIPLFGFFSGVEVAPFHGHNRGLDWTGVLAVFSR